MNSLFGQTTMRSSARLHASLDLTISPMLGDSGYLKFQALTKHGRSIGIAAQNVLAADATGQGFAARWSN